MSHTSRFTFLKSAAAAAVAGTAAATAGKTARGGTGSAPRIPDLYGVVDGWDGTRLSVRQPHTERSATPTWTVEVSPTAKVWRLHDARLADFRPGEEIIAFGTWANDSRFIAAEVSATLAPVEGRVTAHGTYATADGEVDVRRTSRDRLSQVQSGARFRASTLRNVDTGEMIAFEVGPDGSTATS